MVLERASDSNLRRLKATDGSKPVFAVFAPAVEGDWKACFMLADLPSGGVAVHSVSVCGKSRHAIGYYRCTRGLFLAFRLSLSHMHMHIIFTGYLSCNLQPLL